MRSEEGGGLVIAKLEDGEDFFSSLREIASKHGMGSGVIINGIGMLKDSVIGYFPGSGAYEEESFHGPMEMTSMQGNIATKDGGPVFHVHVNLAGRDKRVHGGHLIKGTVNIVNEIAILRSDDIKLSRQESAKTGLPELKLG